MSKYSAVYYPHTSMRSPQALRNAMLLWDHVDCIVPWGDFPLTEGLKNPYAEAAEILLKPRVPLKAEKNEVDRSVSELFREGAPTWINELIVGEDLGPVRDEHFQKQNTEFLIYPQKLLPQTWNKLVQLQYARTTRNHGDWAVPPTLGLLLMAELATAFAGNTQHLITDRSQAYSCLFSAVASSLGGEVIREQHPGAISSAIDRLVTMSVVVADPSKVTFERILDLRRREAKERTGDLRQLRHKYLDDVGNFSNQMLQPGLTARDRTELVRQYKERAETDFREVKRELGMARNDLLFSKEVGLAVVAVAGVIAQPVVLGVALSAAAKSIGVGALVKVGVEYQRARRKALAGHAMSWLLSAR